MVAVAAMAEILEPEVSHWLTVVGSISGIQANQQIGAIDKLTKLLKQSGLYEKCLEIYPCLGSTINSFRAKLKWINQSTLTNVNWVDGDLSEFGTIRAVGNNNRHFTTGLTLGALTGLEPTISLWQYTSHTGNGGTSSIAMGIVGGGNHDLSVGWHTGGSSEGGQIRLSPSGVSPSTTGFQGVQNVASNDRRARSWRNGSSTHTSSTTATGTWGNSLAVDITFMAFNNSTNDGGVSAIAHNYRSCKILIVSNNIFGLEADLYYSVLGFQNFLNRA
jgi:hypothetical protein